MFKYLFPFCLGAAIGFWLFASDNAPFKLDAPDLKPEVKVVTKVVTNPGVPEEIVVFHDDKRGVTCYYKKYAGSIQGAALSCIPDIQLRISQ